MLRAFHPFVVPPDADKITLSAEESFHLAKVLRANSGEPIEAFDGHGNIWCGKVLSGNAKAIEISIDSRRSTPTPPCHISLAQAMPKGSHMDDIVRQATELGAARIYPLQTSRCEVHLDSSRATKKLERWNAIAVESCKQCGNALLPEILPISPFSSFIENIDNSPSTLRLIASLEPDSLPAPGMAGCRGRSVLTASGPLQNGGVSRTLGTHQDACCQLKLDKHRGPLPSSLREKGEKGERVGRCLLPHTPEASSLPSEILFLVGPEGDFSPDEYLSARKAGFIPTRLTRNVLRSVTAAVYALALADQIRQTPQFTGI